MERTFVADRDRDMRRMDAALAGTPAQHDAAPARPLPTMGEADAYRHLIFFPLKIGNTSIPYAFKDDGCAQSLISTAAAQALLLDEPLNIRPSTAVLCGWFGAKGRPRGEIDVPLTMGQHTRVVRLLIVDDLEYDLVVGNDIFRGAFKAGIRPGSAQEIVFEDGSSIKYSRIHPQTPLSGNLLGVATEEGHTAVFAAKNQVIPGHSLATVQVCMPTVPVKGLGLFEEWAPFAESAHVQVLPVASEARRVLHLLVLNPNDNAHVLKVGTPVAIFQPVVDQLQGVEVKRVQQVVEQHAQRLRQVIDSAVRQKDASAGKGARKKNVKDKGAATDAAAAPTPDAMDPIADELDDKVFVRPISTVEAHMDTGVDGVSYDERMEIPRNTPQGRPDAQIDPNFPPHLLKRFADTINACLPVADSNIAPQLAPSIEPMRIVMNKDTVININRPLPLDKAREVDRLTLDYVKENVVRPSTSEYNAPVLLVRKPDGSWRFCVDWRGINAITQRDAYQFPRISDMLESLAGSKVFSTIDLAASFHQLALAEDAKKYTAFSTLSGHWEFNRVTFGLTNAPPWMQRAISKALTGLEWKICVVWIDDIIIHSKTHEQHIEDLKRVMLALREHGFSVRLSKCHFGMSKVTYLGHSISADGIGTSDANVKDILACPEPKTVKELQRVLGLFNYYRRFVHQYAQHVKPLSAYLAGSPRGHTPITLTEQARSAFHHLRLALAAAPVLAYPDFSKPFIVEADCSQHHAGGILSQLGDDGQEHPIAYWSQTLSERQSHWSAYKREMFALISACKQWRRYLQVKQVFTARFDQSSLRYLVDTKDREPMLAGWILQLEEFGIKLEYQPGEKHQHVDALTKGPLNRNPYLHGGESYAEPPPHLVRAAGLQVQRSPDLLANFAKAVEKIRVASLVRLAGPQASDHRAVMPEPTAAAVGRIKANLRFFAKEQEKDDDLQKIAQYVNTGSLPAFKSDAERRDFVARAEHYRVDEKDGVLYHLSAARGPFEELRQQRAVPRFLRHAVMVAYHDAATAGHFSFEKAYPRLSDDFYWSGMANDFYKHCRGCHKCGARNRPRQAEDTSNLPGALGSFPPLQRPVQRVAMDIIGPFTPVGRYRYALVITDHFSRFVWICKLRTQSVEEIARRYITVFENAAIFPSEILTDRGSGFALRLANAIYKAFEIRKKTTSAYHPQCNGMPERFNHTLAAMLAKLVGPDQQDWPVYLAPLACAYNQAHHPSIGMAPVKALLGFDPVSPLVASLGRGGSEEGYASPRDAEDDRLRRLLEAWQVVRNFDHLAKERQKAHYDKRHKTGISYEVGDKVWLFSPSLGRSAKVKGLAKKLSSRWAGPYMVSVAHNNKVNYKLRNVHGRELLQWVHIHRLKPYVDRPPPDGPPVEFINEPAAAECDDFNPAQERDFDFEFNSDRWEPGGPDEVSDQLWELWSRDPRPYLTPAAVPPVPREELPTPDFFAPRQEPTTSTPTPAGQASSAAGAPPAAVRATPPPATTRVHPADAPVPSLKPAPTPSAPAGQTGPAAGASLAAPLAAPVAPKPVPKKKVRIEANPSSLADRRNDMAEDDPPLAILEFKRELRDFVMQLQNLDLDRLKDGKRSLREFRRSLLLLLEGHFGDIRKLKQQCNTATLQEFRSVVSDWFNNFDQVFADKIAAFRARQSRL